MCDFISWIENYEGEILVLSNKEIATKKGRILANKYKRQGDIVGHGAIEDYFGSGGSHYENNEFWNNQNGNELPKELAKKMRTKKALAKNFGNLFKYYLTPSAFFRIFEVGNRVPKWLKEYAWYVLKFRIRNKGINKLLIGTLADTKYILRQLSTNGYYDNVYRVKAERFIKANNL